MPLNPNVPVNPSTGNAKLLVAPFIPVRVEPVTASQRVNDLNNGGERGDGGGGGGGEKEEEKEYRMVGSFSFPDEIMILRATIVHWSDPDVRCKMVAPERLGNETRAEFSANVPLQGFVADVTTVKCFY